MFLPYKKINLMEHILLDLMAFDGNQLYNIRYISRIQGFITIRSEVISISISIDENPAAE